MAGTVQMTDGTRAQIASAWPTRPTTTAAASRARGHRDPPVRSVTSHEPPPSRNTVDRYRTATPSRIARRRTRRPRRAQAQCSGHADADLAHGEHWTAERGSVRTANAAPNATADPSNSASASRALPEMIDRSMRSRIPATIAEPGRKRRIEPVTTSPPSMGSPRATSTITKLTARNGSQEGSEELGERRAIKAPHDGFHGEPDGERGGGIEGTPAEQHRGRRGRQRRTPAPASRMRRAALEMRVPGRARQGRRPPRNRAPIDPVHEPRHERQLSVVVDRSPTITCTWVMGQPRWPTADMVRMPMVTADWTSVRPAATATRRIDRSTSSVVAPAASSVEPTRSAVPTLR